MVQISSFSMACFLCERVSLGPKLSRGLAFGCLQLESCILAEKVWPLSCFFRLWMEAAVMLTSSALSWSSYVILPGVDLCGWYNGQYPLLPTTICRRRGSVKIGSRKGRVCLHGGSLYVWGWVQICHGRSCRQCWRQQIVVCMNVRMSPRNQIFP